MGVAEPLESSPAFAAPLWGRAAVFCVAYFACAALGRVVSMHAGAFVAFWLPSGRANA